MSIEFRWLFFSSLQINVRELRNLRHVLKFAVAEENHGGNPIDKILLTASGGPFFGKKIEEMRGMTREQALAHPNWSMGAKITIDSATCLLYTSVFDLLDKAGYTGWIMVEAEQDPAKANPFEYAKMGREYITAHTGLGLSLIHI